MAELFLPLFIIFFIAELILDLFLNRLNCNHVKSNSQIPKDFKDHIDIDEYQKSQKYTIVNLNFGIISSIIGSSITIFILFSGILPWINEQVNTINSGLTPGVMFLISITIIQSILGLPMGIYHTFKIEAEFGFNKMTPKLFMIDLIKGIVLSILIGAPLLYAILWFIQSTGQWWWIITAVFILSFQIIMMLIYPIFIAPLFNKFKPLEDGELKSALIDLAKRLDFAAKDIYVMDGSKRSGHSNAYFTGFGKMRRIVLYDTLIEQLTVKQLVGVLAHEIGHNKKKHIFKMLLLSIFMTTGSLYLFSIAMHWQGLYTAFGFNEPSTAVGLFLFFTAFSTFTFVFSPLSNMLSRKHEFEADAFAAAACDSAEPLCGGLINLAKKNLSNLTPHPLYSFFHYSHPTITERIATLRDEHLCSPPQK